MVLKLTGSFLVTCSCGALGMWKAAQWKEHLKMLEQLKKMVIMLRGEILYTHAPLGEAFGHVGRKSDGILGELFLRELEELTAFGEHLGYLDLEMQEHTVALYMEQLDMSIGFYREHEREQSRLYTSLGIMGGLFLSIMMC